MAVVIETLAGTYTNAACQPMKKVLMTFSPPTLSFVATITQIIPNRKVLIASIAECEGSGRKRLMLYPNAKPTTTGSTSPKNSANARYVQRVALVML